VETDRNLEIFMGFTVCTSNPMLGKPDNKNFRDQASVIKPLAGVRI